MVLYLRDIQHRNGDTGNVFIRPISHNDEERVCWASLVVQAGLKTDQARGMVNTEHGVSRQDGYSVLQYIPVGIGSGDLHNGAPDSSVLRH